MPPFFLKKKVASNFYKTPGLIPKFVGEAKTIMSKGSYCLSCVRVKARKATKPYQLGPFAPIKSRLSHDN